MSFTEGTFSYSSNTYPKITQSGTDDTASFLTAMEGISSVNVTTVGDQSHSTFKIVDFGGNALHIEGDLDVDFGRQIWIFKGTGHKDRLYVKSSGTLQLKSPQTENGFSFNPEVGDIIYAIEGSGMGWNSKALRVDNNTSGKSNFIGVNFRGEFSATITGSVRFENCIIDKIGNDGDIQFNISNTTEMVDCKMYASGTSGITFRAGNPTISNVQIFGARDSFNNESNSFQVIEKLDSDTGARADISQFGGWKTGVKNAINGTRFLWANHLNNSSTNYSAGSLEVTQTLKIKTVDDQYNPIAGAKFYLKDDASLANADLVTVTNSATPFSFGELSQGDYVTDSGTLYITRTNVLNWVQGKKYGGNNYVVYSGNYYKSTTSNNYSQPDVADWNLLGNTFTDAIELFRSPSHTLTNFDTSPATTQRTYEKTTDSNGEVAEFEVLIGEGYSPQGDVNGWVRSRGKNPKKYYYNQPYTDDIFDYAIVSYAQNIFSTEIALRGADGSEIDVVLQPDFIITENSKTTVDAYTTIDTPQKFYDIAKSYLVDNYAGEVSPLVSRDGNTIDAGSYDVVVSSSAVNAFSLSSNTLTLKASSFVGDITTSGSVTLTGVSYTGTIIDSSGTRSFGSYEIKNLVSGSRVQVYNLTSSTEIYNNIVNATTLSQGFGTSEMVDGDSIRVRITYQNGSVAKEPQELTVTCRTPSWEVNASQENATEYNAYQVDGSGINEFTLDLASGKIEVDINDSDNSTNIQRVGAWYYAELMTSNGISDLFGAINWVASNQISIDQSKVNLQLDNKKADPLLLTGGRLYRLNETTIIAPTSNSIQIDYSPIYITNAPLIEDINKNTKLIPALL
jgi:hypothetical protein